MITLGFLVASMGCVERARYVAVKEDAVSSPLVVGAFDVVGKATLGWDMNTCSMAYSNDVFAIVSARSQTAPTGIDCAKNGEDIPYSGSFAHVTLDILHPLSQELEATSRLEAVVFEEEIFRDWPEEKALLVGMRRGGDEWIVRIALPVELSWRDPGDTDLKSGDHSLQLPSSIEELTDELRANEADLSTCYPTPSSYPFERISDERFFEITRTNDCHTYDPSVGKSHSEPLPGDDTYQATP